MHRARHTWVALAVLLANGCALGKEGSIGWRVDFECDADAERTQRILVGIAEGECPGSSELRYEAVFVRGAPAPEDAPGSLPDGVYAFRATALDAANAPVASACVAVTLPGADIVELMLLGNRACSSSAATADWGDPSASSDAGETWDGGAPGTSGREDGGGATNGPDGPGSVPDSQDGSSLISGPRISASKTTFLDHEKIAVQFADVTKGGSPFIGIYADEQSKPLDPFVIPFDKKDKKVSGSHEFKALPAGGYDVRLVRDDDRVLQRIAINVLQDSDRDGTPNQDDLCANDANKVTPGACGCGYAETDQDGDGTLDCLEQCPTDGSKLVPGVCGCGVPDVDSDGDGTLNCRDACPTDGNKSTPGVCGCGNADSDSDGDATADCQDRCPQDGEKTQPLACGCGMPDVDSDGDGTADCQDRCPQDGEKTQPLICGCGVSDGDGDGDGIADCQDGCPQDGSKSAAGVCGCGLAESFCAGLSPGLQRARYTGSWSALPDFTQLEPDAKDVAELVSSGPYPALDSLGLVFTGYVAISKAGTYDFGLSSDGGSRLDIDGNPVVVNDGENPFAVIVRTATLSQGIHSLRVAFADRSGGEELRLQYRPSGGSFVQVPASVLFHGSGADGGHSACVEAKEDAAAQLSCPGGQTISAIDFASYGTPTGSCGKLATGSCHAESSQAKVAAACVGKSGCALAANNSTFSDPCQGKAKRLAVAYTCAAPGS